MDKITINEYIWNYRNFGSSVFTMTEVLPQKEQFGKSFYTSAYICPTCHKPLLKSNAAERVQIQTPKNTNYMLRSVFYCPKCHYLVSEAQKGLTLQKGQVWFLRNKKHVEDIVTSIDKVAVTPVNPIPSYCELNPTFNVPQQRTAQRMTAYAQQLEQNKDTKTAMQWFWLASELGEKMAQYRMGIWYLMESRDTQNEEKAADYSMQAAEQGDYKAQEALARLYWSGRGVEKNQKKALDLWALSANQGCATAQYELGARFASAGKYYKSVPLLQEAAKQGVKEANELLGRMVIG